MSWFNIASTLNCDLYISCNLDIGDIYLEQEKYKEAAEYYEKVLVQDTEHPWALPSWYYATVIQNKSSWRLLASYYEENPFNQKARSLYIEALKKLPEKIFKDFLPPFQGLYIHGKS